MKVKKPMLIFGFVLALFASGVVNISVGVPILRQILQLITLIPDIPALLIRALLRDFIIFGQTSLWAYTYPPSGSGSEPIPFLLAVSVSYPSTIGGIIDFGITFLVSIVVVKVIMDRIGKRLKGG